ncbi:MAG: glycosyltransferase family A protein [Thermosynechococcaceae cyanobacterium]
MLPALSRSYLERYAEPMATEFDPNLLSQSYEFVLVIPVYNEATNCLEQVLPADLHNTLVIVVVNAAEADEPLTSEYAASVHNTRTFLEQFHPGSPLTVVPYRNQSALLIVDCCSQGRLLPKKQGVGLARKIGGDLAVACIAHNRVASPWIHCTDADVELPLSYFGSADPDIAAAIYPFRHQPIHRNILQYEISLRYYVLQLAVAGSPYAFQTIGSLMKINVRNYVMVRGFPKRRAAEDFYMLNKLAKTGKVVRLKTPIVSLSSRVSQRVPFGTGAAMGKLVSEPELQLYNPEIFGQLRDWLGLVETLWCDRTQIQTQGLSSWWPADAILLDILQSMALETRLQQAYRQCSDLQHFRLFLWSWFDAFKTLKFVHALRDQRYPSQSMQEALPSLNLDIALDSAQEQSELTLPLLECINQQLIERENQLPSLTGPTES